MTVAEVTNSLKSKIKVTSKQKKNLTVTESKLGYTLICIGDLNAQHILIKIIPKTNNKLQIKIMEQNNFCKFSTPKGYLSVDEAAGLLSTILANYR